MAWSISTPQGLDASPLHAGHSPCNLLGFPNNLPVPIYTPGWREALIILERELNILTHCLLELFAKNMFLDILVVLRLDLGQISFNLVENAFAKRRLALATRIASMTFWLGCAQKSKFLQEKVTYVFGLFDF